VHRRVVANKERERIREDRKKIEKKQRNRKEKNDRKFAGQRKATQNVIA